MGTIESLKRILEIESNWELSYRICAIAGEKDPCWIRQVFHAIETGSVPQIAEHALMIIKSRLGSH